jgi:choline dehydrogenase-like flavoprotein
LRTNADFNGERQEGFGLYQVTQRKGERWSAARAYVEPIREAGNFAVRTDTLVEKLVIEEGRVTGVQVRRGGASETLHARRGVVLSAGAFNSPQILMLSGIGPAEHLKSARDRRGARQAGSRQQSAGPHRLCLRLGDGQRCADWQHAERHLKMVAAMIEHRRKRTGVMTTPYAESGGFWHRHAR